MWMLRATLILLTLVGCAATDTRQWHTTDGRSVPVAVANVDWTICKGRVAQAVGASQGTMPIRVSDDVMLGCMAEKGYVFR
jgi:hypothetical protein